MSRQQDTHTELNVPRKGGPGNKDSGTPADSAPFSYHLTRLNGGPGGGEEEYPVALDRYAVS